MIIAQHSSPNFSKRRHGRPPDMVVLHHTAMASCAAAIDRLCDPGSEVSAHYVIAETGAVYQLVEEEMRAWHAGAGQWGEVTDINSHSIGIELANAGPLIGFPPFPEPQMAALERLLSEILARHNIAPKHVIAHSDMAPARKSDPGPKFDWQRLARRGLSVWPEGNLAGGSDFFTNAGRFGYAQGLSRETVLAAFRLRFRPVFTGPLDQTDCDLIHDLANRFPIAVPV